MQEYLHEQVPQDSLVEKLVIGQYIDSYLPAVDGVIITVQNYAKWLNIDGCECYVASAEAPEGYKDTDPFKVIRYRSVPIKQRPPYRFGLPGLDRDFKLKQHRIEPNLLHAHSPFSAGRAARLVAKRRKIPLVATFHSKYYDDILQATGSKILAEQATHMIVEFYNNADYVWTVNSGAAQTLRDYGYEKDIEIMRNGTDFMMPPDILKARAEVEARFALEPNDKVLLFVGQQILQKNLMLLLDAAALYKNQGKSFKLIMVGEGYAKESLIEHAAELGLSDIAVFAGVERDRESLCKIYLRADLFVFPSVYDNAPLVVREAAMAGCPSLLIQGSSAAENVQDGVNAFLCENTAQSICDTIRRALQEDELRKKVGLEASKTIAKPWEEIVQQVLNRYNEIVREYPARP